MWDRFWKWFLDGVTENWPQDDAAMLKWLCADNWGRAAALVGLVVCLTFICAALFG
jgi:hypothetical protein